MEKWRQNAQDIAVKGVFQKFSQNNVLLKMLKSVKVNKIVKIECEEQKYH